MRLYRIFVSFRFVGFYFISFFGGEGAGAGTRRGSVLYCKHDLPVCLVARLASWLFLRSSLHLSYLFTCSRDGWMDGYWMISLFVLILIWELW